MQDNDFFSWRREMLLRFQEITDKEEVYSTLEQQTQLLEFDFLHCVSVIRCRLRARKSMSTPRTRMPGWHIIRLKIISR
jgi:hypothetical protein